MQSVNPWDAITIDKEMICTHNVFAYPVFYSLYSAEPYLYIPPWQCPEFWDKLKKVIFTILVFGKFKMEEENSKILSLLLSIVGQNLNFNSYMYMFNKAF